MINDIFHSYGLGLGLGNQPIPFYTLQVWDGGEEEELGRGSMCGDDEVLHVLSYDVTLVTAMFAYQNDK